MALSDARPQSVVIFDLPGNDSDGLGFRERIAACYRFARHNGWHVAEVCDVSERICRDELERAVAICKYTDAGLLVYRAEFIARRVIGNTKLLGVTAMPDGIAS
jgi:hypothetical protein